MSKNSALLDIETHSLLTLDDPGVINFLPEAIPGSYRASYVNSPNYLEDFFILSLKPAEYPQWMWSALDRTFFEAAPHIQTEEIRRRSRLAHAKARATGFIIRSINIARMSLYAGTTFQETVYLEKKNEAQKLKDNGYMVGDPLDFPYIVRYADHAKLSIKDATDAILSKARSDTQFLAKTEDFRIRHFDSIKKATTPEEVNALEEDFWRDGYYSGIL